MNPVFVTYAHVWLSLARISASGLVYTWCRNVILYRGSMLALRNSSWQKYFCVVPFIINIDLGFNSMSILSPVALNEDVFGSMRVNRMVRVDPRDTTITTGLSPKISSLSLCFGMRMFPCSYALISTLLMSV